MRLLFLAAGFFTIGATAAAAAAAKPTRFWNLTAKTIISLRLAKPGRQIFGTDFCKADKDGSVDHDERLNLPKVNSGHYDVKIGYAGGRTCLVKNVSITAGKVFSIEEKDLTGCSR